MGYKVKVQENAVGKSRSYYVNLPLVIAEMLSVEKGEVFEWSLDARDTLVLKRLGFVDEASKGGKQRRKPK